MRILIAEDEAVSRKILQTALEKAGFEVIVAIDGDEAWKILQQPDCPSLAILDWIMPGIEGVELCRRIRECENRPPSYTLLLTGKDSNDDIVKGLHAGADDYVAKPFDREVLLARVRVGQRVLALQSDLAGRISELKSAISEVDEKSRALKESETKRLQDQKLKAAGQLSAGIAHEINTPIQYVGDNTRFVEEAFDSFDDVFRSFEILLNECKAADVKKETIENVEAKIEERDIEFLQDEIPVAIQQSLEGIERVSRIVQAMKNFSHPGASEKTAVNLHEAIESTITVSRNEWKYVSELQTEFDPNLGPVRCFPGDFNQVVLNLIVNAAHAIEKSESHGDGGQKGLIRISTRALEDRVEIRISDNGTGIPAEAQPHVFDPFFTTKEVGKGTGQGLAIAYNAIVDKHKGSIEFETKEGAGTTFIIQLPLNPEPADTVGASCE